MTRRIIDAWRTLLGSAAPSDHVHFHSDGLNGEPAVCYDSGCRRPQLDAG